MKLAKQMSLLMLVWAKVGDKADLLIGQACIKLSDFDGEDGDLQAMAQIQTNLCIANKQVGTVLTQISYK